MSMKTKPELTLRLSPREKQILELIAAGLVDREIATELCIAYGTVRNHVDKVVLKLGATNRAHAVAIAIRSNII